MGFKEIVLVLQKVSLHLRRSVTHAFNMRVDAQGSKASNSEGSYSGQYKLSCTRAVTLCSGSSLRS